MSTPILGFICPKCRHGMRHVCDACEHAAAEREAEEAGYQAQIDADAEASRKAQSREIEGYKELEGFFEGVPFEIFIEAGADEDGPTGVFTATLSGVPWLPADSGKGFTPEAAIQMLRREITKALRSAADEIDGRLTASLDDGDRAILFDALEGHADRLAAAGQIERSTAARGLLVRLGWRS